jgi:hypothetical protein
MEILRYSISSGERTVITAEVKGHVKEHLAELKKACKNGVFDLEHASTCASFELDLGKFLIRFV